MKLLKFLIAVTVRIAALPLIILMCTIFTGICAIPSILIGLFIMVREAAILGRSRNRYKFEDGFGCFVLPFTIIPIGAFIWLYKGELLDGEVFEPLLHIID